MTILDLLRPKQEFRIMTHVATQIGFNDANDAQLYQLKSFLECFEYI